MPIISQNGNLHVKLHDFKNNISRYIRWMRAGKVQTIIVKRHNDPVGVFIPVMGCEIVDTQAEGFVPDEKAAHAVDVENLMKELREEEPY